MWNGVVVTTYLCSLLSAFPTATAAEATSVTLASGEVIEGAVLGRILIGRMGSDGTLAFRIVEGKDIDKIDEAGVHARGESVMLVGIKNATAADILQGLIWWNEGADLKKGKGLMRDTGQATVAGVRLDSSAVKPGRERLVGGYTIDKARKEVTLLNSIRLELRDGQIRTIPLSEMAGSQP